MGAPSLVAGPPALELGEGVKAPSQGLGAHLNKADLELCLDLKLRAQLLCPCTPCTAGGRGGPQRQLAGTELAPTAYQPQRKLASLWIPTF